MSHRPPLPDGYELPERVNGWRHDPDSEKNAHVWTDAEGETAVGVYDFAGTIYAKVADTRAGASEDLFRDEYDVGDATGAGYVDAKREAARQAVEKAIDWMDETPPSEWAHPDVVEAVFDPPAGYVLDHYFHGDRESIVYYRREDADAVKRLAGAGEPDEYTINTCPYLYIHVWNGSGNATVALAPWRYAHGPGSKYPEVEEVAETPDRCGLEVAVRVARQWARDHFGNGDMAEVSVGQAGLGQFGDTGGERA